MTNKNKLILAGGLFGGALVGYAATIRTACNVAFSRKPILSLGNGENPLNSHPVFLAGRQWLETADNSIVSRESSDGTTLVAHYYPAENACCTIIAAHGWRGGWNLDFAPSAPYWHAKGCNLLLLEQRGQGQSGGKYMTFGVRERLDIPEWVDWYQKNYDAEIPILLSGVSMGSATVLMASDVEYPVQVKGILADCGFSSPYEIIRKVAKESFHMPEHPICDGVEAFSRLRMGVSLKEHPALEAVKEAKLPIFFVHGLEDRFVPRSMSIEMYMACSSRKDLWLVPNAGHAASFVNVPEEYIRRVSAFFAEDIDFHK